MAVSPHRVAAAAVGAATLAAWFLIGYLSEGGGVDHMVKIPQLHRGLEIGLGVMLAGVAISMALQLRRDYASWLSTGWAGVYGRLAVAGAAVAAGARIVSAGGSGANIGGGMVLMLGPWPLLFLLGTARWAASDAVGDGDSRPKVVEAFTAVFAVVWGLLMIGAYRCGIC